MIIKRISLIVLFFFSFVTIVNADSGKSTLSATFTSFTAALGGENIVIKWQTANETNTSYFNVQTAKDGTNFKSIGKVSASGTSNTPQNYQFAYAKTDYIQFFSIATLLLISITRPKKYFTLIALALVVIIFMASCKKEEVHGTLYFRLEQVDINGSINMTQPVAVNF